MNVICTSSIPWPGTKSTHPVHAASSLSAPGSHSGQGGEELRLRPGRGRGGLCWRRTCGAT
jgi:hypothetical protein